jgi:hypothetical protein
MGLLDLYLPPGHLVTWLVVLIRSCGIILKSNKIYTQSNTTNTYIIYIQILLVLATSSGLGKPLTGQNIYKNLNANLYGVL